MNPKEELRLLEFDPDFVEESYVGVSTVTTNARNLGKFINESKELDAIKRYVHIVWLQKIFEEARKVDVNKERLIDIFLDHTGGGTSSKEIVPGARIHVTESKAWEFPEEILILEDELDKLEVEIRLKKEVLKKKKEVAKADGTATVPTMKDENGEEYEIKDRNIVVTFL